MICPDCTRSPVEGGKEVRGRTAEVKAKGSRGKGSGGKARREKGVASDLKEVKGGDRNSLDLP